MNSDPAPETAFPPGAASRTPTRSKLRVWSRRLLLALLVLVVVVTLGALFFDLATNGSEQPASALYRGPFVRVDRTKLAYRSWGRQGAPVVLLGGAAEPSWVWHDVGPLIARAGHRVFALDLPPFGYSQRRGPYTMAHWLQLVRGFERRLHIVRPVVVGHSLGAGVAAAAGLASPRDVAAVVLLDGDALAFGGNHTWLADLLVYPYFTAVYRLVTGSDSIVARVLRNAWGPKPAHTGRATLVQFERPFRVQGTDSALRQLFAGRIPGVTRARERVHGEGGNRRASVPRSNAIGKLGGVFGVAVLASVFARVGGYGSPAAFVHGSNRAVFIGGVVVLVAAAAAAFIPGRRPVALPAADQLEVGLAEAA